MRYDPDTALQLGLLHRVVGPAELRTEALTYAASLAAQALLALQSIKRLIRASFEAPGREGLELERDLFLELVRSDDAREGVGAFLGGRKPSFSAR
jgi:enoyl-CoA hydratase